jgi:outer membrane protein assembly factor BamB
MAARKAFARVQAILGLIGIVASLVTYSIVTGWNPLPSWGNWIANATTRTLSKPATTWVKRSGNEPMSAAVVSPYVVVATNGSVEVHSLSTGEKIWDQPASWAATAGDARRVVFTGRLNAFGFDVFDVATGIRLWGSNDKDGVWAYTNEVLLLRCSSDTKCTLRAVSPTDGAQKWSTNINGAGKVLLGAGHALASPGAITDAYTQALAATPAPAPSLIGLPMADAMHVLDTSNGHELRSFPADASKRSVLAGGTVVATSATFVSGTCRMTISGQDPRSGATLWSKTNYDAKTTSGMACDQRRDPVGGGQVVYAVDSAGRDNLLQASTGDVLFTAKSRERIVATDGQIAVVRSADKKSLYGVDLAHGKTLWTRPAADTALVGITPNAVLIADPSTEKLAALDRVTGLAFVDVESGATVLGAGGNQVIINIGRSFGPLGISAAP